MLHLRHHFLALVFGVHDHHRHAETVGDVAERAFLVERHLSRWSDGLARHPHELVLDLGRVRTIRGFRYLARQDSGWNGAFAETEFWIGDTPDSFGEVPAATASFAKKKSPQPVDLPAAGPEE